MNKEIIVALLQIKNGYSLEDNFMRARKALIKAKNMGADIALFPELWTIGYKEYPKNEKERNIWKEKSTRPGHKEYERYLKLSKDIGIAMVFTFLESNKQYSKFYNSSILIDSNGIPILHYRKTHLVNKDWEVIFTSGKKFPVATLKTKKGNIKIGLMICYDREFPEVARILMLNGAELILVPNACILENNRIAQFQTRGFENMVGVAMTNYPKYKNYFNGKSVAFDGMRKKEKNYNPLLVMAGSSESIVLSKFNIENLRKYRKSEIWGDAYRRPNLYKPLIINNPKPPFIRKNNRR